MAKMIHDKILTDEQIEATRQWINERPECIRQLLLDFPPGCLVKLKPGIPLCKAHESKRDHTFMVGSYNEDNLLGLSWNWENVADFHVDPTEVELITCRNGIDRAFVESCL